jgi:SAM-dependent methyltransferase
MTPESQPKSDQPNSAQQDYWDSAPGRKWIEHESLLDAAFSDVLDLLLSRAALCPGHRVLDIGCGTGASALAASRITGQPEARQTGAGQTGSGQAGGGHSGSVDAVDISPALLQRARDRACAQQIGNLTFTRADAQTHPFADRCYDQVISRFGVMFFDDPVAAFANINRALKPGGAMTFVAWSGLAANPWFAIPQQAAVTRLGAPQDTGPAADPTAPGPLAFQDRERVCALLTQAGFSTVKGDEVALKLRFSGGLAQAAALALRLGPAARIIGETNASEADVQAIAADIGQGFAPFDTSNGTNIPATLNLFTANRP